MRWLRRQASQPVAAELPSRPAGLSTARLNLRPLDGRDVDALHRLWTQPGLRRFLWDDRVLAFEQTRDLLMQGAHLFEQRGLGLWGSFDAEGVLVGFCGYGFFRNEHELELMYGVDEPRWFKGYAREMAEAMVAYGFETLKLAEIRASTDAPNLGSQRILKRLGFVPDSSRAGPREKLFFRLPRGRRDTAAEGWEAA